MKTETLKELRQVCKANGIKVRKQTLSWGPHISFEIDGQEIDSCSIYAKEFIDRNRETLNKLKEIRPLFEGMTIDGQKVYGIRG